MASNLPILPPELLHEIIDTASSGCTGENWSYDPEDVQQILNLRLTCKLFDKIVLDNFLAEAVYENDLESWPLGKHETPSASELDMVKRLVARQVEKDRTRGKSGVELIQLINLGVDAAVECLGSHYDDQNTLRETYADALITAVVGFTRVNAPLDNLSGEKMEYPDGFSDEHRFTVALVGAACLGRVDDMERLIEKGADPLREHCYHWFDSAFRSAAIGGSVDAMEFLIDKGVDVKAMHNPDPWENRLGPSTALHHAAMMGNVEAVDFLMSLGIEGDLFNGRGETPFLLAAAAGRAGVVDTLLEHDVDGDIKGKTRRTPLNWAIRRGYFDVVKILLEKRSLRIDSRDTLDGGISALGIAALKGREDMFNELVEYPLINLNVLDAHNHGILKHAAVGGNENIVKKVLTWPKSSPNHRGKDGSTPLMWAASKGHDPIVKILLTENGVDVNATIWDDMQGPQNDPRRMLRRITPTSTGYLSGESALEAAVGGEHESTVRILLGHPGVDPNQRVCFSGWTPLICSIKEGHEEIAGIFMGRRDVDVNLRDENGFTALDHAILEGREDIVEALVEHPGLSRTLEQEFGAAATTEDIVKTLMEKRDSLVEKEAVALESLRRRERQAGIALFSQFMMAGGDELEDSPDEGF